ncbi:hypothetical protein ACLMJK_008972 [Lecanora helva]
MSMAQEVDAIELAWTKIRRWSESYTDTHVESSLLQRLSRSLECGTIVMSALQQDLLDYTCALGNGSIKKRLKFIWNERALRDHQDRIRGQAIAMNVLLQALDLPTETKREEMLRREKDKITKSDESAYSIVPSRLSSRLSLSTCWSIDSTELLHSRLTCEDDLFTARPYKRIVVNLLSNSRSANGVITGLGKKRCNDSAKDGQVEGATSAMKKSEEATYKCVSSLSISDGGVECSSLYRELTSSEVRETYKKTRDVDQALHKASKVGFLRDVETLCSSGATVEKQIGARRWTALHHAAAGRDRRFSKVASFLLDRGANATATTSDSSQPIHMASHTGSVDVTRLLLDANASPHCLNNDGYQPLHLACQRADSAEMISLLVCRGANFEAKSGTGGKHGPRTALQMACSMNDNINSVKTLLKLGAEVNHVWPSDYCPLELAIINSSPMVVNLLLRYGADPNMRNAVTSETCLLTCARVLSRPRAQIKKSMIESLLSFGADPAAKDGMGNTILHFLVNSVLTAYLENGDSYCKKWRNLIRDLIKHGADPATPNEDGESALTLAAQHSNLLCFEDLYHRSVENLSLKELLNLRNLITQNVDDCAGFRETSFQIRTRISLGLLRDISIRQRQYSRFGNSPTIHSSLKRRDSV